MKMNITYETVGEAINALIKKGYTTDFEIMADTECLICNKTATQLSPDEFEIDETYRFEGNTDPGEMIVFAISSTKYKMKGIIVNAYGMYSDSAKSKIVERLRKHIEKDTPIKCNEFLKPLSREHHHALLLCWKIKTGISKGVSSKRIKTYADLFYKTDLLPRFEGRKIY